jgi:hypothetical protein
VCGIVQALFRQKLELCSVVFNFEGVESNKRWVK